MIKHLRSAGDLDAATATLILDTAAAWRPDRIVMGSHGRSGLPRLLLGSIANDVLRAAPCTVDVIAGTTGSAVGTSRRGTS